MRILIDPGSHHLLNAGDVAMLQICVRRLRELWPGSQIEVMTEAPSLLARYCPDADPLPASGRYLWLRQVGDESRNGPRGVLPRGLAVRQGPAARLASRALVRSDAWRRGRGAPELTAFVRSLLAADLFVMSGRGGVTDAFRSESLAMLAELGTAVAVGIPAVMLGQGFGPIGDRAIWQRARTALPRLALVAAREGRAAPALLAALGVPPARTAVTGDDAIELAYGLRRPSLTQPMIGLSLRVADYAGLTLDEAAVIVGRVGAVATRLAAGISSLPISTHPNEDDCRVIGLPDGAETPQTQDPAGMVSQIARCRVVVTGSYHGGVFALAQGIPTVCLYRTPYYRDKLLGLRAQFGDWCSVIELSEAEARLDETIEKAWLGAADARPELLESAERQIEAGRAAYASLGVLSGVEPAASPQLLGRESPPRPTPSEPVTGPSASRWPS